MISMFATICAIQFGALFVLALAESYSSVKRSLLAAMPDAARGSEAKVLPLVRPATIADDRPRYKIAS